MTVAYPYCMRLPENVFFKRSLPRCSKMTKNESALLGNLQAGYVGEIIDLCVTFSVHGTSCALIFSARLAPFHIFPRLGLVCRYFFLLISRQFIVLRAQLLLVHISCVWLQSVRESLLAFAVIGQVIFVHLRRPCGFLFLKLSWRLSESVKTHQVHIFQVRNLCLRSVCHSWSPLIPILYSQELIFLIWIHIWI